jgi:hypothetical protein
MYYVYCITKVHLLGNPLIKSDWDALKQCTSNTDGVNFNGSVSVDNNIAVSEVLTDHDNVAATSGHAVTADNNVETETGTCERQQRKLKELSRSSWF